MHGQNWLISSSVRAGATTKFGRRLTLWLPVRSMSWRLHAIDAVTGTARWRGGSRGTHAGSSDPCAFLNLGRGKAQVRVVKKNINPQWMQTFRFPCDGLNDFTM